MSYDYLFKLIFIGDTSVGKTAIIDRLMHDRYLGRYDNTIGVDFACINTVINNKDRIKAHIWDTAGQESFASIITTYYRGIAGAAIIFDLTRKESFQRVDFWLNELKNKRENNQPISILLIGNKKDRSRREVTIGEIENYAKIHDLIYIETSAKTGENVHKAFSLLIKDIYKNMDPEDLGIGIRRHFSYDEKEKLKLKKPSDSQWTDWCCCLC
jgi:small GTP-binding protein